MVFFRLPTGAVRMGNGVVVGLLLRALEDKVLKGEHLFQGKALLDIAETLGLWRVEEGQRKEPGV